MSLLKSIRQQLGLSSTATQNFTLTAEAADGTLKLARGNAGATTQDILTVDASGDVLVGGNNLNLFSAKSLAANGYQKLPSGLIIQWGLSSSFSSASNATVTLPIAFPTTNLSVVASWSPTTGKDSATPNIVSTSLTNFVVGVNNTNAGKVYWIALGY